MYLFPTLNRTTRGHEQKTRCSDISTMEEACETSIRKMKDQLEAVKMEADEKVIQFQVSRQVSEKHVRSHKAVTGFNPWFRLKSGDDTFNVAHR